MEGYVHLKQLTNCRTAEEFCKIAAEVAKANPNRTTMNQIHRAAKSSRHLDWKRVSQRVAKVTKGVARLRTDKRHELLPAYIERALIHGETCPAKFAAKHG